MVMMIDQKLVGHFAALIGYLNIVNHDNSLRIHDLLEDIRNDIIFDKSMGIELEIADNILIRYEAIVKMINDGRKSTC